MSCRLDKIIFQRDNIKNSEANTHPLDVGVELPLVAGKPQELVPKEHQFGKHSRLELTTSHPFNKSG